ncbi:MAG TPA: crosslink repair DNA glycosylase YcaQ family protein [Gaiella sp.]|nr:crosslink repair DNA glycosylase YcaQ family protein [Gaiella sp.]
MSLKVTREQILAFRRRVGCLDVRLPPGATSLARAARAGLQDSVPRSALHSLHARVEGTVPEAWEDPSLVQVWGLRYTAYVVPAGEHAPFTLGRLPDSGRTRRRAEDLAARLHAYLEGRRLGVQEAGRGLGVHHNALRYAALTGTVLIRWGGARQPTVWTVPRPEVDPLEARAELARRYLHALGPATAESFSVWAGTGTREALATFEALGTSLVAVRTPLGEAFLLAEDEPTLRAPAGAAAAARLLPSGDVFYLLQRVDRELLVRDPARRAELWTSRVWPGALLLGGDVAGTWRRAGSAVTVTPWRRFSKTERDAVETEAATLPLPDVHGAVSVRWDGG